MREKLHVFDNWPHWADLTLAMLEENEVWDIIDGSQADLITAAQTRKKEKENVSAFKILKKGDNGDLL